MAAIRDRYAKFREHGAEVAAIAVDTPKESAKLAARHDLPFPLLSDADRAVITEWKALNRKERGGIAFPSTWVIDSDLEVRYRCLERKAKRVDPQPLLRFLAGDIDAAEVGEPQRVGMDLGTAVRFPADAVGYLFRRRKK